MTRPAPSRAFAWYALVVLFLVYVMSMADRQLVGILAEDIKRDLHLSDSQLGIVAGPAIAFFYALLGVPMAYIADRVNRIRFLAASLAFWSVMTIFGGWATNLLQLSLTRVGVSVAEGGATPSSVSLLADFFPSRQRATAMALWTSGSAAGIFVGFALGGLVNQAIGWRNTFVAAGVPGVVLALILLLTIREPLRGATDEEHVRAQPKSSLSMFRTFTFLWKLRVYRQVVLASAGCNFCVFGVLTWAPAFAHRSFGVGTGLAGTVIGTAIALAGGGAMVVAGFVSDYLARKGYHRPLLAVAGCVAISGILFAFAFMAPSFRAFAILFACAYAALMANPPINWVIVQGSSPPEMRAMATAIYQLVINMLSSVPAPLLIGFLSDHLRPTYGDESLKYVLVMLLPVAAAVAALLYVRVSRLTRTVGLEASH